MLSEGAMAFFVELVDASVLMDGAVAKDGGLELPDSRANGDTLYRGVFWQVTTQMAFKYYCRAPRCETHEEKVCQVVAFTAFEVSLADPAPAFLSTLPLTM